MTRFLSIASAALLLSACTTEPDVETQTAEPGPVAAVEPAPTESAAPAEATMSDGVQVVDVAVGKMGYEPARIALQAGIPARLVFTRTVVSACAEEIMVPAFGVEPTDLPLNEPVAIEFTPDESGEFAFACGMDMMRGQLVVRS
jgi:plastocyanin domain-containing protein